MDMFAFVYIGILLSLVVGIAATAYYLNNRRVAEPEELETPYRADNKGWEYKSIVTTAKRPYTKHSKYWMDKRNKAVAAKARSKTKRKSK